MVNRALFVKPQRKLDLLICLKFAGIFNPMTDLTNLLNTSRDIAKKEGVILSAVGVEVTDDVDIYYFEDLRTDEAKRERKTVKLIPGNLDRPGEHDNGNDERSVA